MTKEHLYQALVDLCQQFGFTTEATYDHLHYAIESIVIDDDEPVEEIGHHRRMALEQMQCKSAEEDQRILRKNDGNSKED